VLRQAAWAAIAIFAVIGVLLPWQVGYRPEAEAAPAAGGIVVASPLRLDRTTVSVGDTVVGTVAYRNTSRRAISLPAIVVAARTPSGANADFSPTLTNRTIRPREVVTLRASRTIDAGDEMGGWRVYSAYQAADASWAWDAAWTLTVTGPAPATPTRAAATATPTRIPPTNTPAPVGGAWRLTFVDDFDGAAIDRSKWLTTLPWGSRTNPHNREQQTYLDENVIVQNGLLRLRADRREATPGFPYISGVVTSWGKFEQRYGRFEMRARMPAGRGFWPAFWLLHSPGAGQFPWPPEIDIMEFIGSDPWTTHLTNHYSDGGGVHRQQGRSYTGPDFSAGFHVFAVEWEPGLIVWTVDGVERHRVAGGQVPDQPMYVILNLAVGGFWPGPPDSATPFPATYDVDYVRVYARG
jgi:beta-glucanase (GH16 family)